MSLLFANDKSTYLNQTRKFIFSYKWKVQVVATDTAGSGGSVNGTQNQSFSIMWLSSLLTSFQEALSSWESDGCLMLSMNPILWATPGKDSFFFPIFSPKGLELMSIDREPWEANKPIEGVKIMSGYHYRQLGFSLTRDLWSCRSSV